MSERDCGSHNNAVMIYKHGDREWQAMFLDLDAASGRGKTPEEAMEDLAGRYERDKGKEWAK